MALMGSLAVAAGQRLQPRDQQVRIRQGGIVLQGPLQVGQPNLPHLRPLRRRRTTAEDHLADRRTSFDQRRGEQLLGEGLILFAQAFIERAFRQGDDRVQLANAVSRELGFNRTVKIVLPIFLGVLGRSGRGREDQQCKKARGSKRAHAS